MPKRLTLEQAKEIAIDKGLELLDNVYINKNTKMTFKDNDGYLYHLTLDNVKDKRTGKFDIVGKRNKYTIQNIQKFIENNGSKTKILSNEFIDNKTKMKFKCECGEIFELSWTHMLGTRKVTCNNCGRERTAKLNRIDYGKLCEIVENMGYKLITSKDKFTNKHKIDVEDSEGYRYSTSIYTLETNKNVCNKFNVKNNFLIHNICNYIKNNNLPIDLVDKTERKVNVRNYYFEFYCCECGEIYKATLDQIRNSNRFRCNKCSLKQSNIEWLVEKYLILKDINYIKEKRFEDCRNKNPLPFDFYLEDYSCALEIQGSQHYYENEYFQQNLEERQKIDKIKEEYCKNNGIKYIAIPYWLIFNNGEKETYKKIIDKIIE